MNEIALGWKFNANSQDDKIISYSFGVTSFPLPAMIIADTDEQANKIRDDLHDITLYDIVNKAKGRLIYRDFTLFCNINEGTNSAYSDWLAFGDISLTVTTDEPYWFKGETVTINTSSDTADSMKTAPDFPYDFEYDYGVAQNKFIFENNSFFESNFIMKIQGRVDTPKIYINGHLYSVDVTLTTGEILEIDSRQFTVKLIKANGQTENCFDLRSRESNIFKKIAAGTNKVTSNQKLDIILTYFDERGEPRWS